MHDEVGPLGKAGVIGGIDAEEMRDDGGRDRCYVVGHEIAATRGDDPVEQIVAQRPDEWFDPTDPMLRDRRVDDPADLAVTRFGISLMSCSSAGTTTPGARKLAWNTSMFFGRREHIVMTGQEVGTRRRPRNRALSRSSAKAS